MKASFRHIFAALIATAALVACTKETVPGKVDTDSKAPAAEGTRVIAVSFTPQTKTTLEGFQPKFVNGKDTILLCTVPKDDNEPLLTDTCVVAVDGSGKATISTNLTGQLAALYPAKFSKSDKGGVDITIPSVQSGKFSDANICRAEMEGEDDTSLHFENCCPVLKFYVDTSIGVKSIKITSSTEHIASNSMTITVKAPEGKTLYDVMPSEGQDRRICYVALDGKDVHSTELKFETETTTQGPVTRTPTKNVLLKNGYMYNAFIPYYIEVNGQKWAYCNIGAFLPEEPGEYFSWAEVKGHKADTTKQLIQTEGKAFAIKDAFCADFKQFDYNDLRYHKTWDASKCFAVDNAPYYVFSTEYQKYTGSDYNTLQLEDDAASVNWGGNWRMPTMEEFDKLINGTSTDENDFVDKALKIRGEDLVLPAAGIGDKTNLRIYAEQNSDKFYYGYYWSSTLNNTDFTQAYSFSFLVGYPDFETIGIYREYGLPIRPIVDEPQEEIQSGDDNEDYNHQSTSTWFDEE